VTGAPVGYALRYADGSALRRRATANLGARGVNLGRRSGVNFERRLTRLLILNKTGTWLHVMAAEQSEDGSVGTRTPRCQSIRKWWVGLRHCPGGNVWRQLRPGKRPRPELGRCRAALAVRCSALPKVALMAANF